MRTLRPLIHTTGQFVDDYLHASDHLPPLAYSSTQSRTSDPESQPLLQTKRNNPNTWGMVIIVVVIACALTIICTYTPRDELDRINREVVAANYTLNHLHNQVVYKKIDLEHWTLQVQIAQDDHASICAQMEHSKMVWEEERQQHHRELEKERKRVEDWRREDDERYRREREEKKKQEEEERQRLGLYWDRIEESPFCASYGTREYTAHLSNLPDGYDGLEGCRQTAVEIHGVTLERPVRCEDRVSARVDRSAISDEYVPGLQWHIRLLDGRF